MAGRQRIDRVRRQYNQWVANQTLEDYALRFTAKSARRWSAARVANTALGAISFLALEAIGGTITLNYGVTNATAAILVVSVIIFCCGLPIAYHAAKCGIDIDLLTRGAGFGYIGSTITSLIYASFTFIFFAIEAVILATALEMCFGIPRPIGYLDQRGRHHSAGHLRHHADQPLSVMDAAALDHSSHPALRRDRLREPRTPLRNGRNSPASTAIPTGHLDLLLFGTAASVVFSLVAQIGEQVDFLRFLPRDRRTSKTLVVDRAAQRRPRLDRARRAQAAGRIVPGVLCARAMASPTSTPPSPRTCISKPFATCCRSRISRWR